MSRKRQMIRESREENFSSPIKLVKLDNDLDASFQRDREIVQRGIEKNQERRLMLKAKHKLERPGLHIMRRLQRKEELVESLMLKISELEKGNKDNDDFPTPTHQLVGHFKKLEEENDTLRNKVTDLESALTACKCKLAKYETELLCRKSSDLILFDGNVLPTVFATEYDLEQMRHILSDGEKKIQRIEMEKNSLKQQLNKSEANRIAEERQLRIEIRQLKYQLLTLEIELSNEQARHTELLDDTIPVMIMASQRKPQRVETDMIQIILDKLRAVSETLIHTRQQVKNYKEVFEALMRSSSSQIQEAIKTTDEKNKELVMKYSREIKLRKAYHNQLVELRGNIRVYCRVRPCIKEDCQTVSIINTDMYDDGLIFINTKAGKSQQFQLDKVFNMDISQSQIFEEVSSLVRSAIDGFNVCIFAYGQTGSGKTYTMEGPSSDPGVNQRALKFLYEETKNSSWQYTIAASMLEIYNESIRDLLNPDPQAEKLEVKMKPEGGLHVPGLVMVPVQSLEEVNKIFETGRQNRSTAATSMNERSSRSHSLLCVTVEGLNLLTGNKTHGRLNLVDLAGSERVSKSHADGARLKEAQSINKSLSSLGDVISALKNKHSHIPYRNSKLTYLLQESLGGDSKTLMILQVSPVEKNVSETVCTLTFGQRVRSAELGAATRKLEEGKNTPSSSRRPNNETPKLQTPVTPSNNTPTLQKGSALPSKLMQKLK